MAHKLILLLPKAKDARTQKVLDSSIYLDGLTVVNCILEVTPPGYDCPVIFNTSKDFNITLNTANLKIYQSMSNGQLPNLPDGVYHFKYSIDPNTKLFVEYDMLRTSKIDVMVRNAMKELYNDKSKVGKTLFNDSLDNLLYIVNMLDTATYFVEDGDIKRGTELYNEAYLLLKNYKKCKTC